MRKNNKLILLTIDPKSLISFKGDLIRALIKNGFKIIVLSNNFSNKTKQDLDLIGAEVREVYINRLGLNIFKESKSFLQLIQTIRNIEPNYIITYFAKSNIFGLLSSKIAGVKNRYAIIEGLGYPFTKDPNRFSIKKVLFFILLSFFYKLSLSQASKVFFLNKDDLGDFRKFNIISKRTKSYVLGPIGINPKDYPYYKININEPISFLFIGRLIREKGILEFLKAAKIINQSFPTVKFIVLGSFEDKKNPGYIKRDKLRYLLDTSYITWPGNVDVLPWIKKSHVFVLPSYREGFPRSTQEVMSVGRAVITTDVPGCRDTVIEGKNGFIVPAGDIYALVKTMKYFICNPEKIILMGKESYLISNKFFSNKIFNKSIIEQIKN
tara:strand:+ start:8145 stop:9287 length:1143 start_codon:yes stop_codon:yes gene_type:complete